MNSHENNAQFGQDRVSDLAKVSVHVICLQKIGGKSGSVNLLCLFINGITTGRKLSTQ